MGFPLPDQYIPEGEWEGVQRNFDALGALVLDTGGRALGLRVGVQTLTWSAATTSTGATVTHQLGKTPLVVVATIACYGSANAAHAQVSVPGATTFNLQGQITAGAAYTGTFPCYWIAIG